MASSQILLSTKADLKTFLNNLKVSHLPYFNFNAHCLHGLSVYFSNDKSEQADREGLLFEGRRVNYYATYFVCCSGGSSDDLDICVPGFGITAFQRDPEVFLAFVIFSC